jgi:hypothetical protein
MNTIKLPMLMIAIVISIFSCKKKDVTTTTPIEKTDSLKVSFSPTAPYTFFSFKNDAKVSNSDSASSNWDFGLRFTTFIVNSFSSGPGGGGAILATGTYAGATSAPTSGYGYDTTTSQKAIKDGTWYDYNVTTHLFSPKAGKLFFFKTADGKYVKMELLAVDYEPFVGPVPVTLIYRFRYTYQPNGSANF